jgi:hypothetical protein
VDLVAAVVADEEALEVVQPGERALDDPAGTAETRAVLGLATGDLRADAAAAKLAAVLVVVVAAVSGHSLRSPPRPASLAAHRRHSLDEWQ